MPCPFANLHAKPSPARSPAAGLRGSQTRRCRADVYGRGADRPPGRGRDHACPPAARGYPPTAGLALPNRAAGFQATTPSEAAKPTKSPRPPQAVPGPAASDGCKPRHGALPLLLLALPPAKSKIAFAAANDRGIFLIALYRRLGARRKPRAGR